MFVGYLCFDHSTKHLRHTMGLNAIPVGEHSLLVLEFGVKERISGVKERMSGVKERICTTS